MATIYASSNMLIGALENETCNTNKFNVVKTETGVLQFNVQNTCLSSSAH